MSFLKKVKEIGGDLADSGKRSAQRGKLELEVRRLEGKINDEKNGIGQAVVLNEPFGAQTYCVT